MQSDTNISPYTVLYYNKKAAIWVTSETSLPIFALKPECWQCQIHSKPFFFKAISCINFDTPIKHNVLLIMILALSKINCIKLKRSSALLLYFSSKSFKTIQPDILTVSMNVKVMNLDWFPVQ